MEEDVEPNPFLPDNAFYNDIKAVMRKWSEQGMDDWTIVGVLEMCKLEMFHDTSHEKLEDGRYK